MAAWYLNVSQGALTGSHLQVLSCTCVDENGEAQSTELPLQPELLLEGAFRPLQYQHSQRSAQFLCAPVMLHRTLNDEAVT